MIHRPREAPTAQEIKLYFQRLKKYSARALEQAQEDTRRDKSLWLVANVIGAAFEKQKSILEDFTRGNVKPALKHFQDMRPGAVERLRQIQIGRPANDSIEYEKMEKDAIETLELIDRYIRGLKRMESKPKPKKKP